MTTDHLPELSQRLDPDKRSSVLNGYRVWISKGAKLTDAAHISRVHEVISEYTANGAASSSLGFGTVGIGKGFPVGLYFDYRKKHVLIVSTGIPFPMINPDRADEILPFCLPYTGLDDA